MCPESRILRTRSLKCAVLKLRQTMRRRRRRRGGGGGRCTSCRTSSRCSPKSTGGVDGNNGPVRSRCHKIDWVSNKNQSNMCSCSTCDREELTVNINMKRRFGRNLMVLCPSSCWGRVKWRGAAGGWGGGRGGWIKWEFYNKSRKIKSTDLVSFNSIPFDFKL